MHRAAVEKEFLGERRFAGVRMRNDRKGSTPRNFIFNLIHYSNRQSDPRISGKPRQLTIEKTRAEIIDALPPEV
jgi:hypothetical protein